MSFHMICASHRNFALHNHCMLISLQQPFLLMDRPNFSDEIFEEEALKEHFEVFEKNLKDIDAQIMEVKNALSLTFLLPQPLFETKIQR
jgi:hypothetical protein